MDKMICRGRRLDNQEWVEGYYVYLFDGTGHESHRIYTGYAENDCGDFYPDWSEVDPETVGQFTGLLDKNGKKIFEGDMLKPFDDEIDKMVVEFHHGAFMLCLYGERGYMGEGGWVEEGNYGVFECEPLSSYGDDIEVIGNVHDTPELLKGE